MELTEVVDQAGAIVAIAAAVGIALLVPLYVSQRRDLHRLVEWMEREPAHPAVDYSSSEALLDRAEAELEALEPPPDIAPAPSAVAQRVTSERPALERITMERAALIPHPRWRRFVARVTQPRWLVAIAAAAVLLGIGAIFGSQLLLETGDEKRGPRAGEIEAGEATVAVLNGSTVPGLGSNVSDEVKANGFQLGTVSTVGDPVDQTVVLFEKGSERPARRLAADLGAVPVQPIDRQSQRLAEGADVVVIAGQDRAGD